jgi:hypothetical protein
VEQEALAAFMVENNHVVGFFLDVVGDHVGTTLAQGFHDLGCLRTCSGVSRRTKIPPKFLHRRRELSMTGYR